MVNSISTYNMWRKKFAFLLFLGVISSPAMADSEALGPLAPLNYKAVYHFGYGALTFGKIGLDISQTPDHALMASDVTSTGIMNALLKHSSHSTLDAKGSNYHYNNINYETNYQTKGKKKYAHIVYKNGEVADEKVMPPDDREKRPAVSKELKDKAVTPLGFGMAMRQALYDHLKAKDTHFSLYLYDGRRASEVDFVIVGRKTMPINGTPSDVVQVDMSRKLLEGYTQSELADSTKKEPPLHVYWSHDERLIPLLFEVPMMIGSLSATLAHECGPGESCLLGLKE